MSTDDGRTTDAGVIGILIAHLGAFGSGELKREQKFTEDSDHDKNLYKVSNQFGKVHFIKKVIKNDLALTEKLSLCEYLMNMLLIFCQLHCSQ